MCNHTKDIQLWIMLHLTELLSACINQLHGQVCLSGSIWLVIRKSEVQTLTGLFLFLFTFLMYWLVQGITLKSLSYTVPKILVTQLRWNILMQRNTNFYLTKCHQAPRKLLPVSDYFKHLKVNIRFFIWSIKLIHILVHLNTLITTMFSFLHNCSHSSWSFVIITVSFKHYSLDIFVNDSSYFESYM